MTTKVHRGRARVRVGGFFGKLESERMRRRISTASSRLFNPGASFLPFVMTEIGMTRASRDDEIIVGNGPLGDIHRSGGDVDRLHLRRE